MPLPLSDDDRHILAEQERDAADAERVWSQMDDGDDEADPTDLDDGGFDRDEWCPPDGDVLPPAGPDDEIPF